MCVLVSGDVSYSLEPLETRRLLSAVSWDGGGDDSHWADPLNWSGDQVPTVNDDVTINVAATHDAIIVSGSQATATLTLAGSLVVDSTSLFNISRDSTIDGDITLDGGTITGAKLTINTGTFRWQGGDLLGDMFTVNATGTMELTGGDMQLERFVQDSGTTNWTSGHLLLKDHTFENKGTLTVDSNQDLSCQLATGATSGGFLNHNQLTKLGNGTLTIGAANALYYDNGKTSVEAGTFDLGRIANANALGSWTVKGTGTLLFPASLDPGDATVTMIGTSASFPALATMDHLDGSLQLLDGAVLNSAGYLTVGGSLTIDPDSSVHVANDFYDADWQTTVLRANAARTTPYISADGNVRVGGNNRVEFVDDYDPGVDTTIPLISGATRSGSTPQFAGSGTPSGRPMGTEFSGGLMSGVVLPRLPMIDLLATSDTGYSDTDNVTSDDTPTVQITNLDEGRLDIKNGTTVLASLDVATDEVVTFTLPHLPDGLRTVLATLTSPGGHKSVPDSTKVLKIRIDTVAPAFSNPAYNVDQTPNPSVTFSFSDDVLLYAHSEWIALTNVGTGESYPFWLNAQPGGTGLNAYTLMVGSSSSTGGPLPDGNYRVQVPTEHIVDSAGNQLASDFNFDFFVLSADGNSDRKVDIRDFNILAANFGKKFMKFSQGNYDRSSDGAVTIADFNLLAKNFGKKMDPPPPPPAPQQQQIVWVSSLESNIVSQRGKRDDDRLVTQVL
jgi:hypothetical protein